MLYFIFGVIIGWFVCSYKNTLTEEKKQVDEDFAYATKKIQELQKRVKDLEEEKNNKKKTVKKNKD